MNAAAGTASSALRHASFPRRGGNEEQVGALNGNWQHGNWQHSHIGNTWQRLAAFAAELPQLEDKMNRRLAKTEADVANLKGKVDLFVQTKEPPLQGVFCEGQLWDARTLVLKLVGRANRSLILIHNWATPEVLDSFAKKRKGTGKCCQCGNVASWQFQCPMKAVA